MWHVVAMGKGWAKGLTVTTDPRIARAAAGHRGLRYVRRRPIELDARMAGTVPTEWSDDLAYAVGLIATDRCLLSTGRHVAFTTQDQQLADTFLRCLGRSLRYGRVRSRSGALVCRVQLGDVRFYRWLEAVGLTPRKSLTLGSIAVPDEHFLPFTRGLLDGDGSIINKSFRANTRDRSDYYWEYLQVKFISASARHITWLSAKLRELVGVDGYVGTYLTGAGRHPMTQLRYGKRASLVLLPRLYADSRCPKLERKWRIWDQYQRRHATDQR